MAGATGNTVRGGLRLERRAVRRPEAPGPVRSLRVAVFTTSYPRDDEDFSGRFVHGTVEHLRERGVEVDVVGPGSYRDFGLTANNGAGFVGNLKRRPWLAPLVLLSMVRALRTAARSADLVHANWLAGAVVARFAGRPFVVTLHGSPTAGRFDNRRATGGPHTHPVRVRRKELLGYLATKFGGAAAATINLSLDRHCFHDLPLLPEPHILPRCRFPA